MNLVEINIAIAVAGLVVGVLGLILVADANHLEPEYRRFFYLIFGLMSAYAGCVIWNFAISDAGPSFVVQSRISLFLLSAISSLMMLVLNAMMIARSGDGNWRGSNLFNLTAIIWTFYFALLLYTQFSTTIYYYDEANVYHRGPLYPLLLLPPILIMGMNLIVLWHRRAAFSRRGQFSFLSFVLFPLAAMILQILFYGLYLIILGTAVACMVLYVSIQKEQNELYVAKERENAKLKTNIMLAQIQPHFIYNSLGVIQGICEKDAHQASLAIKDFTKFLGHNIDSLSTDEFIPFETEWKHVEAYVSLQKLRFGDAISIESDFETTYFKLPTLTLQPVVENAITYGVRKNTGGKGTVIIRTQSFPDRFEITVEDNGPGFVKETVSGDERTSHIGLQNVKDRLAETCHGDLKINSIEGIGTTVTLVIPREEM